MRLMTGICSSLSVNLEWFNISAIASPPSDCNIDATRCSFNTHNHTSMIRPCVAESNSGMVNKTFFKVSESNDFSVVKTVVMGHNQRSIESPNAIS